MSFSQIPQPPATLSPFLSPDSLEFMYVEEGDLTGCRWFTHVILAAQEGKSQEDGSSKPAG
jgi:hypothetical protein